MIFVERSPNGAPAELIEYQQKHLAAFEKFFSVEMAEREHRWPDFNFPPRVGKAIRDALISEFNSRCSYCGRHANTIDHFRPRSRAGRSRRHVDLEHYWWLAFEWTNLYLACATCNRNKANLFPIDGPAAAPMSFGSALNAERPLLLDPCSDRPEQHMRLDDSGSLTALSVRGEVTISVLRLNDAHRVMERFDLMRQRAQRRDRLLAGGVDQTTIFEMEASPLALEGAMLNLLPNAGVLAGLTPGVNGAQEDGTGETPSPPSIPVQSLELPTMVWIEKIEIQNFKGVDSATVEFPPLQSGECDSSQPWIMLLGENGVGKTTILQAVALAAMPDDQRIRFGSAKEWLSDDANIKNGFIHLTYTDGSERRLSFSRDSNAGETTGEVPPSVVLGYGCTRLLPSSSSTASTVKNGTNADNLFDPFSPLIDAEPVLSNRQRVNQAQFELLASGLERLLPDALPNKLARKSGRLHYNGTQVNRVSGGYKSILALAMDMMFHLSEGSFDMESAPGLVMIDEIELHLHPRWKIRLVEDLRCLFPAVRFIVSTHDPLCVHGLRNGELHVLARSPRDGSLIQEQIDVPKGSRAEDVLTGPWFGMSSTLDFDTLQLMTEHSELLQRLGRNVDQDARMADLQRILQVRMPGFGATKAQRAAIAAAAVFEGDAAENADQVARRRLDDLFSGTKDVEG
ncbi:AAA family ATPase [Stenotrophomonas sp.]|uniref:AAA family ATPase n=1 Tax=Stenotrophomonas sp. TaxID=69392 RepID=UPI0028A89DD4|nr:AAA family ATPase [Stenotrophomonas sp.]